MCSPALHQLDQTKVEAFGGRLLEMLNGGAIAMMISIGHKTGLFDAMSELPPSASDGIARAAGLNERYVREWLGAMVSAGIVHYDAATRRYALPSSHAALLTRAAAPNNFGVTMQWIAGLGAVEDRIVECFRLGGGLRYEDYPRFHELMANESEQSVVSGLIEHVLPLVRGLSERLEEGICVLDAGCSRGRALMRLAEEYPASTFVGYDICRDAIDAAREEARARGIDNLRFEVRDLALMNDEAAYDLLTGFDIVHDQADPDRVLANLRRALAPGGVFLCQDIRASSHVEKNVDNPLAPFFYTISTMHCMSVSLAREGRGLGTCWGEELALSMFAEAGFTKVELHRLDHDIQNNWYVART